MAVLLILSASPGLFQERRAQATLAALKSRLAIAAEDGRVGEAVIAAAYPHLATSLTPSLSDACVAGLDAQKNFLRDWGFLAGDFATRDWMVEGPLEEARALVRREARFAA